MKSATHSLVLGRGMLTSVYKKEIKESICAMKSGSLFRVKSRLKKSRTKLSSEIGAILKISLFAIVTVLTVF